MLRFLLFIIVILCFTGKAFSLSTKAKWAILTDAATGEVLFSKNASKTMPPSSMTKLMVAYIVFEKLKDGVVKPEDKLIVSERAWHETGSRMFLLPNRSVTVEDLLRGVIVHSGNDASVVLAEGLAGSESAFVDRMNMKARALGMNNTHFMNSTGLHQKNHYMTTEDLLILSNRLIKDFPEYYKYFAEKEFTHNKIKQQNRNILLFKNIGVDGLKMGHTDAGGYGISVSAVKSGRRLIAIVNGCLSENERAAEVQKILQYGFMNFSNVDIVKHGVPVIKVDVLYGQDSTVDLVTREDVMVTVPADYKNHIKSKIKYPSYVDSSVSINEPVGVLEVDIGNGSKKEFNLYLSKEIKKSNWFGTIYDKIKRSITSFSFEKPELKMKYQNLT